MTDKQIAEIYAIARSSLAGGQRAIQMQSFPFKMTAENLAKHRLDPNIDFWKQLKEGSDHFEVTLQEPQVAFCNRRYVFNAAGAANLDPEAACPPLKQDPEIAQAVAEKSAKDEAKIAQLAQSGVKPVRIVYQDGGQHPAFASRVPEVSRPETIVPPTEIALDEKPNRGAASAAANLAVKSPVVTLAGAKAADESRQTRVVAMAPMRSEHRDLSALAASDPSPTNSLKKLVRSNRDASAGDIPRPPASIGVRKTAAAHSSKSF
jgi:hypothetical protein